jgi:hypothetical protein
MVEKALRSQTKRVKNGIKAARKRHENRQKPCR